MLTVTGGPDRPADETTIVALAPDDVTGAALVMNDGSIHPTGITNNTVDITVDGAPRALRWRLFDDTEHTTEIFTGSEP